MSAVTGPFLATVTLNPAIDQSVVIARLAVGGTNRCQLESLDPGGKGINASRVAHRLGRPTLALGFVGGVTGQLLRQRLDAEGVHHRFADVAEATRLNVVVYESGSRRRTRLYTPGARVAPESLDWLRDELDALPDGCVVVLAGSVPPGLPADVYAELTARLRAKGLTVVLDAQGPALLAALGAGPTLIKPNVEEASEAVGRTLHDDADVLAAAAELRRRGAEAVVVSQGEQGAIALSAEGAWKVRPPPVDAVSTVGSGDSMVAGLAIGLLEGRPFEEALRLGTAAGAATALSIGTRLCRAKDVAALLPAVTVTALPAFDASPVAAASARSVGR